MTATMTATPTTTTITKSRVDFDNVSGRTISPSKLAHVVFRTSNLKAMRKFYEDFLGGETSFDNGKAAFLSYDDEHHRIAFLSIPDLGTQHKKNNGFEHMAFTFDSLENLLFSYRQRKALGITPAWCVNHGPTVSIYYNDPDNNMIETQVDTMEAEAASDYLRSDEFAKNPIGVDFDPEDFIERLKKGESEEGLMKRPDIGERDLDSVLASGIRR